ncbi:hypothetical protein AHV09_14440 [Salmonella enterica subsp. enterica]|nr:hypothetical protein [Salmonella enterica subsp. enterica serovar Gombe]
MDRRSAPVGAIWLVNQVLEEFFAYAAGKCQSKKRGPLAEAPSMRWSSESLLYRSGLSPSHLKPIFYVTNRRILALIQIMD